MSAVRAGPRSTETASATKNVWSPASCSARVRASIQPSAPSISGREPPLSHRDAVPVHERRPARGKPAARALLLAAEDAEPRTRRRSEQLVERRLLPDRDPDQRRVERERDERRDRDAHAVALVVDGEHGDVVRHEPHQAAKVFAVRHAPARSKPSSASSRMTGRSRLRTGLPAANASARTAGRRRPRKSRRRAKRSRSRCGRPATSGRHSSRVRASPRAAARPRGAGSRRRAGSARPPLRDRRSRSRPHEPSSHRRGGSG